MTLIHNIWVGSNVMEETAAWRQPWEVLGQKCHLLIWRSPNAEKEQVPPKRLPPSKYAASYPRRQRLRTFVRDDLKPENLARKVLSTREAVGSFIEHAAHGSL
jgi:hypothetical protein